MMFSRMMVERSRQRMIKWSQRRMTKKVLRGVSGPSRRE